MWKNYLKIVTRNFRKNIGYSAINLAGLAVGLACCILILLWVQDELSYDRFHKNKDQLYLMVRQEVGARNETGSATIPFALAPILKEEFPEILDFSRYQERSWQESPMIAYGDKRFYESRMSLVDPSFLRMFSYVFLKGNPQTALQEPNSVVITEETANKYFGAQEPVGKILKYNNQMDLKVTAVLKKIPANSEMQFDILAAIQMLGAQKLSGWSWESVSYLLLKPHVRLEEMREKIAGSMSKFCPEKGVKQWQINLLPMTKIHLLQGTGDMTLVYIFSAIAIFILLIACMNYMNLATARSVRRAKEVGLRKVAGAKKGQLVRQFLGEALLLSALAALLALLLVFFSLGAFNDLSQKNLSMDIFNNLALFFGLPALILLVSLVAGSYPAFFLSAYNPAQVLKGNDWHGSRGAIFRKIMVIGQFAISIVLLIGTVMIHQQLHYIYNKELGWDRRQVVIFPINNELSEQFDSFKHELLQNPKIVNVTVASSLPTQNGYVNGIDWWEGKAPDEKVLMRFVAGEYDYLDTFGIKLKEGRNFSRNRPTDISNFIVNEEAVKVMNLQAPVGKGIDFMGIKGQIIGVVRDPKFGHMSKPILPLIIHIHPRHRIFHQFLFAKINPGDVKGTINYIQGVSGRFAPHFPFQYDFLDEEFNRLYQSEENVSRMVNYFTFLALFIACLGLFGLAAYMTEQRKKEIGVRKALGSSASGIVLLFVREFSKWVLAASVIACPVAYYAMNQWLNDYAFHIPQAWWPFVLACTMTFVIAGLTVGIQSIRAARINPVETLRSE